MPQLGQIRLVPHSGLATDPVAFEVLPESSSARALPQGRHPVKSKSGQTSGAPYGLRPIWAEGGRPQPHPCFRGPRFLPWPILPPAVARTADTTRPEAPLAGAIRVPGDKSISHRALMLGALAVGRTEITGLLEGEDVLATAAALNALGAARPRRGDGRGLVDGVGVGGLAEPEDLLDLGNSGTAARLLLGILATHPITAFVTGDASLRRRPMGRVIEPLSRFGARFLTREGGRLPLAVTGAADPIPIVYRLPVPSAQVKSAVLLAGLNTPGATTVIEPQPTRDHTERMLRHFGATVTVEPEPRAAGASPSKAIPN